MPAGIITAMKHHKPLWAVLVLAAFTLTLGAVDLPLAWDVPENDIADGSTIYLVNVRTGVTNTFDVPKGATNATVQIEAGTQCDVYIRGWSIVVNPDGSTPRQYSDKSNVLDVKSPGKSGNVRVRDVP